MTHMTSHSGRNRSLVALPRSGGETGLSPKGLLLERRFLFENSLNGLTLLEEELMDLDYSYTTFSSRVHYFQEKRLNNLNN